MDKLEFYSDDKKFGLILYRYEISKILHMCEHAGKLETGGRLLGYYNSERNCAIITHVLEPSRDTKRGNTWIVLGINGLKNLFDYFWYKRRLYYIGDWHFHPFSSPDPSDTDLEQLKLTSVSEENNCPEPVLMIVGGDPRSSWSTKVLLHDKKRGYIELKRTL